MNRVCGKTWKHCTFHSWSMRYWWGCIDDMYWILLSICTYSSRWFGAVYQRRTELLRCPEWSSAVRREALSGQHSLRSHLLCFDLCATSTVDTGFITPLGTGEPDPMRQFSPATDLCSNDAIHQTIRTGLRLWYIEPIHWSRCFHRSSVKWCGEYSVAHVMKRWWFDEVSHGGEPESFTLQRVFDLSEDPDFSQRCRPVYTRCDPIRGFNLSQSWRGE